MFVFVRIFSNSLAPLEIDCNVVRTTTSTHGFSVKHWDGLNAFPTHPLVRGLTGLNHVWTSRLTWGFHKLHLEMFWTPTQSHTLYTTLRTFLAYNHLPSSEGRHRDRLELTQEFSSIKHKIRWTVNSKTEISHFRGDSGDSDEEFNVQWHGLQDQGLHQEILPGGSEAGGEAEKCLGVPAEWRPADDSDHGEAQKADRWYLEHSDPLWL